QHVQRGYRRLPVDAAVGDALSVGQRLARYHVLATGGQIALDHDAGDALLAFRDLLRDVGDDQRLVLRLLVAVGVAGVDHEPRGHAGTDKFEAGRIDAFPVVVRLVAATQDDVAVLVAGRRRDRRAAALGHRHEMVRMRGRLHGIGRDADIAVGAVLEADWAGKSRRQLAMDLALRRALAD